MIVRAPPILTASLAASFAVALAAPARADASPAVAAPAASAQPASEASPASAARPFRCDGTDGYFFAELEQAGTVGYGETWDAKVCDQGVAVYAEGATSKWAPFRRTRRPVTKDEQALALVLPLTVGAGLILIFGSAAVLSLVGRLRRRVILEAPCPACSASLPVEANEGSTQLFCPMCGAACAIVIEGRGKAAHAHASPLS